MNETHMFDILRKMLDKTNVKDISNKLVVTTENGYELFGKYIIQQIGKQYVITSHFSYLNEVFFSLKNAVIWVTLYDQSRISDAKRVMDLDIALEGANFEIKLHEDMNKKAKTLESKIVHLAKLTENRHKKTMIGYELAGYEKKVKKWQYKQFSDLTS